jgi:hypothetical protein
MADGNPTRSRAGEGPASPDRAAGAGADAEAASSGTTSNEPSGPPIGPPDKTDRKAYLEEQFRKKERGEPIDVEWVAEELQRVRRDQIARLQASQRNMRWLVIGAAILLLVLWAKNGGMFDRGGYVMLGLVALGLIMAFVVRRSGSKR